MVMCGKKDFALAPGNGLCSTLQSTRLWKCRRRVDVPQPISSIINQTSRKRLFQIYCCLGHFHYKWDSPVDKSSEAPHRAKGTTYPTMPMRRRKSGQELLPNAGPSARSVRLVLPEQSRFTGHVGPVVLMNLLGEFIPVMSFCTNIPLRWPVWPSITWKCLQSPMISIGI